MVLDGYMPPSRQSIKEAAASLISRYRAFCIDTGTCRPMAAIKKLDRIELMTGPSGEIAILTEEQMKTCGQMPAICSMPFLEEGAIKLTPHPDTTPGKKLSPVWLYFHLEKADMENSTFSIYYEAYVNTDPKGYCYILDHQWTTDISAPGLMKDGCSMSVKDIISAGDHFRSLKRSGALDKAFTAAEQNILGQVMEDDTILSQSVPKETICQEYHRCASAVFSQITCLMAMEKQKPEARSQGTDPEKETRVPKIRTGSQKQPRKKEPPKPRTIHLGNATVTLQPGTKAKTTKSGRICNRYTESWSVRGHFRHYKNGKVRYIHPYSKGPGRKTEETMRQQKIYKADSTIL